MPKLYSPEELGQLLAEFNRGASLSELEIILGRPISGIVQKMQALSEQEPKTWNPDKVGEYRSEWQRQYKKQHKDGIREYQRQYSEQNKGKWKEFGNYLGQLLEGFNGSKKEAAVELGIHPSLLSHYLAGNRRPNEELLKKVSEKFNVSYEILLSKFFNLQ